MRLHHLRVQAFGPFAGVEEVDVDALCANGLFLLHGPTGAGKTSVLDALCFALYGRVPGARAAGSPRLRSDHAAPGMAPEVTCDLTVAGRRFEVTRSPAWERPKKRGSGTTTEQARTVLRERVGGDWVARSARNDEASQLLTDVLGMGLEQFTKVVLLPQGEFAAFLRCAAEERRPLLERLFGTDRFSAVERWLSEERRRLALRLEGAEDAVTRLVAQAHQAVAGLSLPGELVHDPAAVTDAVAHIDRLRDAADEAAARCRGERDRWATLRGEVLRRRDEVARRAVTLRRLTAALEEQRELDALRGEVDDCAAALAEGRRAEAVSGHLRALDDAVAAEQGTLEAVRRAQEGLDDTASREAGTEELRRRTQAARDEVARLAELADVEAEAGALTAVAHARQEALATCERALQEHDGTTRQRLARRSELRAQVAAHAEAVGDLRAAEAEVEQTVRVLDAARAAVSLAQEVALAEAEAARARDHAQAARDLWLDLREQRLDGMAAELAARLQPEHPCPVCGSAEHPEPAPMAGVPVSREAEDEARSASEEADERRGAADAEVAARREARAARLTASGGLDPERARQRWEQALRRRAADEEAARQVSAAEAELDALTVADQEAARERVALVEELAAARSAAQVAGEDVQRLEVRLQGARGGDASVAARRNRLASRARALDALVNARVVHAHAIEVRERAERATTAACRDVGFSDASGARDATREPADMAALQARVDTHRDRLVALRARLADPELRAVAEDTGRTSAAGELAAAEELAGRLVREAGEAEDALERAAGALALADRAVRSLEDLRAHAAAEVAAAEPLRARSGVVADLARCVDGTGGDNALRMRLSAYVLAARLEQVAEAATVRLAGMSAGRYTLVHSDAAERRGARSGLGLRVVDGWTGVERDTCTLSGGESFLASLALALGLADVVQAESGGSAIETLFVDEGFGSLDDETLEEVMTTLDGLREGGRAVGLVSHVAELRNRIPTRLEVVKTRTGSHLRTDAADPVGLGAA